MADDERQRLAAGHANTPEPKRTRRLARAWRWDAAAERLLALMAAGHPVTPEQRMSAGIYTNAKRAAEAAGIDTRRPA